MEKISAWLFLLIAVLGLLPLITVEIGAGLTSWLVTIAFAVIAITEIAKGK